MLHPSNCTYSSSNTKITGLISEPKNYILYVPLSEVAATPGRATVGGTIA